MTSTVTRRFFSLAAILALSALLAAQAHAAVTHPTFLVGNAGNTGEVQSQGTFGAVAYVYCIGTYEVSNAQYAEFLNAVADTDTFGLYNTSMGSGFGGIAQSGSSGSFTYAVMAGRGDMPVNYVSWYDSIRFANWLNNGQGSGGTETGAYTLLGGTPTPSNGLSITRNAGAAFFLTSEDEWYKAAYYDGSSYSDYPTASGTAPIAEVPAGGGNSANYGSVVGDLTLVGAYVGSDSLYGTFDQGGNLWEWNEALIDSSYRGLRGGSFDSSSGVLLASSRDENVPSYESSNVGFRVARIPEPSTAVLAMLACGIMLWWRKGRK